MSPTVDTSGLARLAHEWERGAGSIGGLAASSMLDVALLLQPHGFEGFGSVVVVVDARDQPLVDPVDEGILALGLDAAPSSLGVHTYEDHDRVAGVDEPVGLETPLGRGFVVARPET